MAVSSIGSGLDINSLVQQLVAAERSSADARLDRSDRRIKAEISAVGTLRSSFGGLRNALASLATAQSSPARKVSVPEGAGFTATAGAAASPGTHAIEVRGLATAHKLSSAHFDTADSAVGTGRLSIAAGETRIDIDLAAPDNSLADLRDAINAKSAGKGLTATLVTADDGVHLVLSAVDTGTSKAITVTPSGDGGSLAALAYPGGMTELAPATNAVVAIDGMVRTSASNTLVDAIAGISLTLTKAEPGTTRELKVAADGAAQKNAVGALVGAYNAAVGTLASTTAYNTSTGVAAPLNGDAMARGVGRDMRELVGSNVAELKTAGIAINKDGTLKFDAPVFEAAIAKDPGLADRLFGAGPDSFASRLKGTVDGLMDSEGALASRSTGLDRQTRNVAKQRTDLDVRMKSAENRYRAQFIGLDTLMTKLQSSMNFLSQQLGL